MKINYKEISVITTCPICHKTHFVEVNKKDYLNWQDGTPAQNVFTYLSADEREMLISGICPICWNRVFGGGAVEEDEEEDENKEEEDNYYFFDDDDPSTEEEMGWTDWGYNEDMGFDPYLGLYTDDC